MFGYLFDRLSPENNARLGKALAIGSGAGWGNFAGLVITRFAHEVSTNPVALSDMSQAVVLVLAVPMVLDGFYGRSIALRDLASRVDVETGVGKKWRWGLALQYWGAWAYWLFGTRRLPPRGSYLAEQERFERFGPLRRARQRDRSD